MGSKVTRSGNKKVKLTGRMRNSRVDIQSTKRVMNEDMDIDEGDKHTRVVGDFQETFHDIESTGDPVGQGC